MTDAHRKALTERRTAEAFPVGYYVSAEMNARKWDWMMLAQRMGGNVQVNQCCLAFMLHAPNVPVTLDQSTAEGLGRAFGTSAELWLNLDATYRAHRKAA